MWPPKKLLGLASFSQWSSKPVHLEQHERPMVDKDKAVKIRRIYNSMNSVESKIGGGEGVEGLYGSIGGQGMQRIFDSMRQHCGFDSSSHLLDIGAGLGRPLLHALITEGIAGASGIEVDGIKCMKAETFLRQTVLMLRQKGSNILPSVMPPLPTITNQPVQEATTLDPATHAFSFWEGIPVDARIEFGRLFSASNTLRCVVVVQRRLHHKISPAEFMEGSFEFCPLRLVESFPVKMSGSGQTFTAFVFLRIDKPSPSSSAPALVVEETAPAAEPLRTPPILPDVGVICEPSDDNNALDESIEVDVMSPNPPPLPIRMSPRKRERPARTTRAVGLKTLCRNAHGADMVVEVVGGASVGYTTRLRRATQTAVDANGEAAAPKTRQRRGGASLAAAEYDAAGVITRRKLRPRITAKLPSPSVGTGRSAKRRRTAAEEKQDDKEVDCQQKRQKFDGPTPVAPAFLGAPPPRRASSRVGARQQHQTCKVEKDDSEWTLPLDTALNGVRACHSPAPAVASPRGHRSGRVLHSNRNPAPNDNAASPTQSFCRSAPTSAMASPQKSVTVLQRPLRLQRCGGSKASAAAPEPPGRQHPLAIVANHQGLIGNMPSRRASAVSSRQAVSPLSAGGPQQQTLLMKEADAAAAGPLPGRKTNSRVTRGLAEDVNDGGNLSDVQKYLHQGAYSGTRRAVRELGLTIV